MTIGKGKDLFKLVVSLVILIGIGGFTIWKLWSTPEPPVEQTVEPTQSRIVTKRELKSFTKLTKADLELKSGTAETASPSVPTVEELEGRYLLVKVKRGGEVKREMVAPPEATLLLSDAVAIGIQPASLTTVGGQLQVGDMVDVVTTGVKNGSTSGPQETFENVMVLNVVNDTKAGDKVSGIPIGVTLAIPRGSRDRFAAAVANAGMVVTRKILVAN
jgi:Flp pilus assembly protein CpaB